MFSRHFPDMFQICFLDCPDMFHDFPRIFKFIFQYYSIYFSLARRPIFHWPFLASKVAHFCDGSTGAKSGNHAWCRWFPGFPTECLHRFPDGMFKSVADGMFKPAVEGMLEPFVDGMFNRFSKECLNRLSTECLSGCRQNV